MVINVYNNGPDLGKIKLYSVPIVLEERSIYIYIYTSKTRNFHQNSLNFIVKHLKA